MRPEWDTAPVWAQWCAMDRDGRWYWHEKKPELRRLMWVSDGYVLAQPMQTDWTMTLEERPQ